MNTTYTFKGEVFEVPSLEQTRDFLYSAASEPDRDSLDRAILRRKAEDLGQWIEYKKRWAKS